MAGNTRVALAKKHAVATATLVAKPPRATTSELVPAPRRPQRRWNDDPPGDPTPAILPADRAPLVQRRCACAGTDPDCTSCGAQRRAVEVSMPGDALEVAAYRAADRAMRFLGGDLTAHAAAPIVQRAATNASSSARADGAALLSRLGTGQALDGGTRGRMEAAFGNSFAGVQIHSDNHAGTLARQLDAHAFTLGQHIAFASGTYRPGTRAGDELLAHELAHTIQQRGTSPLIARAYAGGCAEPLESVDEQRDELSRAGREAHEQIQYYFSGHLRHEIDLPRATKQRKTRPPCPDDDMPSGRMDLFSNHRAWAEIAEIKSVDGAAYAAPEVAHYIRRADELAGRLTDGKPCAKEKPVAASDRGFDKKNFGGDIERSGIRPEFMPLQTVIPSTPIDLGPFAGNPLEKDLSCERRAGGAVVYWCNKSKKRKRRQEQRQVAAKPAEKAETEKKKQPEKKRVRAVKVERGFYDMAIRLNDLNRYAAPGHDWVVAIDPDLYNTQMKQVLEDQTRRMRIDPRSVPIFQIEAPLVAIAPYIGIVEIVIVALIAAPALAAILPVAAGATEGAVVTGVVETAAVVSTAEVTTTAAVGGATYATANGVTLTVIEGGGAAAVAGGSAGGTTVLATIGKGTAAAASLVATILATDRSANAAELVKPLLDKPLVVIQDVPSGALPALSSTVTANGKPFKVVMHLTSRD